MRNPIRKFQTCFCVRRRSDGRSELWLLQGFVARGRRWGCAGSGLWGGLSYRGAQLDYFTVSGEDRVFYPAQAKVTSDGTVEVWSENVEKPIAVRYAWSRWTGASLFDGAGLPASSFRTDW